MFVEQHLYICPKIHENPVKLFFILLQSQDNLVLIDPLVSSGLVAVDLLRLEPESDLLLGVLDRVGAVADVAADVNGEVATDGAGSGGEGVGGTEEGAAGLDGILALPDHGGDGARVHVLDETGEKGLVLEVGIYRVGGKGFSGVILQASFPRKG